MYRDVNLFHFVRSYKDSYRNLGAAYMYSCTFVVLLLAPSFDRVLLHSGRKFIPVILCSIGRCGVLLLLQCITVRCLLLLLLPAPRSHGQIECDRLFFVRRPPSAPEIFYRAAGPHNHHHDDRY